MRIFRSRTAHVHRHRAAQTMNSEQPKPDQTVSSSPTQNIQLPQKAWINLSHKRAYPHVAEGHCQVALPHSDAHTWTSDQVTTCKRIGFDESGKHAFVCPKLPSPKQSFCQDCFAAYKSHLAERKQKQRKQKSDTRTVPAESQQSVSPNVAPLSPSDRQFWQQQVQQLSIQNAALLKSNADKEKIIAQLTQAVTFLTACQQRTHAFLQYAQQQSHPHVVFNNQKPAAAAMPPFATQAYQPR